MGRGSLDNRPHSREEGLPWCTGAGGFLGCQWISWMYCFFYPFILPWLETTSLNTETRPTGTGFVIGPTWEVEEIRMTKHLFYPPIITKSIRIDIKRPNPKSADIWNDKAKAPLLFLNHTIPQLCKSQDWKEKGKGWELAVNVLPTWVPENNSKCI